MKDSAQVVIIGGGIVGCSTAYHLTKMGWEDVVIIDKGELTSGSTWHAAGLVGQLRSERNITRMLQYSVSLYDQLEAETKAMEARLLALKAKSSGLETGSRPKPTPVTATAATSARASAGVAGRRPARARESLRPTGERVSAGRPSAGGGFARPAGRGRDHDRIVKRCGDGPFARSDFAGEELIERLPAARPGEVVVDTVVIRGHECFDTRG